EKYPLPVGSTSAQADDGGIFSYTPNAGLSLARYGKDGKPLWGYNSITQWNNALNLGVTGPGKLWGMTQCMGKGGDFLVFRPTSARIMCSAPMGCMWAPCSRTAG
ncbi:MAG: hypothetical protein ACKO6B_12015, partial [Planctomycetia bacterium]